MSDLRRSGALARVSFLGFEFDRLDAPAALEAIGSYPPDAPFAYVVTPNVDHAVRFDRQTARLSAAYDHAWLTLCDSRILARLAGFAGLSLPVVAGSDLTAMVLQSLARPSDRLAVLGGDSTDIEQLRHRFGFTDLVHFNPPMGFIDDPAERARAVDFVIGAQARFTFLAVGSPRQEQVAYEVMRSGAATGVGLCIGASIEFLTGAQTRAPRWVQRLHLEWLFRLLSDPRRLWRRYLVEGPAIFVIFRRWQRERRSAPA